MGDLIRGSGGLRKVRWKLEVGSWKAEVKAGESESSIAGSPLMIISGCFMPTPKASKRT